MASTIDDERAMLLRVLTVYNRRFMFYYNVLPIVFSIVGIFFGLLGAFLYWFVTNSKLTSTCLFSWFIGMSYTLFSSSVIFVVFTIHGRQTDYKSWKIIFDLQIKPLVWRLERDEWIRYVEYIADSDCWTAAYAEGICGRSMVKKFARLAARDSGVIIIFENRLIIDDICMGSLDTIVINCCHLVEFPNELLIFRLYFAVDKCHMTIENVVNLHTVMEHIDLLVPKVYHEPRQRLERMVELINTQPHPIHKRFQNFQEILSLFYPPEQEQQQHEIIEISSGS